MIKKRCDILNRILEEVKKDQIDDFEYMVTVEQRYVQVLRELNWIDYVYPVIRTYAVAGRKNYERLE